jgi:hypothetical protein
MPDGRSLMNICTQQTIDTTLTLKDTLTETGEYDLNFLTTNLPNITVNQLVAIPAPKETVGWTPLVGLEQILVILLCKVLITCNERDTVLLKGIGRVCGVGKDLTKFKLSCGLLLMSDF